MADNVEPWPLRGNRLPSWEYNSAKQIARTIVEFSGSSKDITKARNNHRNIAQRIEKRAKIPVFVRRDPKNPVGSKAEFIRNKGLQYRMQGLLTDYNESGKIQPTLFCIDLANGIIRNEEYWNDSLFKLCLGGIRLPTWSNSHLDVDDDFEFLIVQRILELAAFSEEGITPNEFLNCYHGRENISAESAFAHLEKSDNEYPPEQQRGVREIMKLMSKTGNGFGANWLTEEAGRFQINESHPTISFLLDHCTT